MTRGQTTVNPSALLPTLLRPLMLLGIAQLHRSGRQAVSGILMGLELIVQTPLLEDAVLPSHRTTQGHGPRVSWKDALPSPPFLGPPVPHPGPPTPPHTHTHTHTYTHTHTHTLTAGRTGEARVVVEVPHGLAGLAGPKHPLAAFHTGSCKGKNTAVSGERNSVM